MRRKRINIFTAIIGKAGAFETESCIPGLLNCSGGRRDFVWPNAFGPTGAKPDRKRAVVKAGTRGLAFAFRRQNFKRLDDQWRAAEQDSGGKQLPQPAWVRRLHDGSHPAVV